MLALGRLLSTCRACLRVRRVPSSANVPLRGFRDEASIPRITLPKRAAMIKDNSRRKVEANGGELSWSNDYNASNRGKLLIACSNKKKNQPIGEGGVRERGRKGRRRALVRDDLASCAWKQSRSVGEKFTFLSHGKNPSVPLYDQGEITFESLGVGPALCKALEEQGITKPTEVQIKMIPLMLQQRNVSCAAETGCGKTFAYLLPCLQAITGGLWHPEAFVSPRAEELDAHPTNDESAHSQFSELPDSPEPSEWPFVARATGGQGSKVNKPGQSSNSRQSTLTESENIFVDDFNSRYDEDDGLMYGERLSILPDMASSDAVAVTSRFSRSPRAVILLPSAELVDQVHGVCKKIVEMTGLAVTTLALAGDRGTKAGIRRLYKSTEEVDLVIATPLTLKLYLSAGALRSHAVRQVVLDEADTLSDDSFISATQSALTALTRNQAGVAGIQLALVSATLPTDVTSLLDEYEFASFEEVKTASLHYLPVHVPQQFLRTTDPAKPGELLKILKKGRSGAKSRSGSTMVFCNQTKTAEFLNDFLKESGVGGCTVLHGHLSQKERQRNMRFFMTGESPILVCTDMASRGIDTRHVNQVVSYEFPSHVSDYVHRVGRVGRLGCHPNHLVINFVSKPWNVDLLWKIETAWRNESPLDGVDANIKSALTKRHGDVDNVADLF